MTLSHDSIKRTVKACVVGLINDFQSQPYSFLFESDLQGCLYAKLRDGIAERIVVDGEENPKPNYNMRLVYSEYWDRIDIVCLNPDSPQKVTVRNHKGSDIHIYELPVLVGIELKYRKMGDRFGVYACVADQEKLSLNEIPHPLVLGFLQDETYEEEFFKGVPVLYDRIELADIDPFESIHVVSPKGIWKVSVDDHPNNAIEPDA